MTLDGPGPPGPSSPPEPPSLATALFGDRLPLARRYVDLLAGAGIERGLLGPREVPRLWDRHVVNCALLAPLVRGPLLADVGSGAGLPGLVVAIRRPDLQVVLVESMARRTDFLREAVHDLGLDGQVRVVRGRAEDAATRAEVGVMDSVTARAVAPLDRLVRWTLPLVRPGGEVLALKGESAREELAATAGVRGEVIEVSEGDARTWVVRIVKSPTRGKAR